MLTLIRSISPILHPILANMARVKNTAPLAPSRFYRGLAGETFLDPAFQNRVHPTPDYHCRRGFETASSIRDSNVVAVRPLRWLTPPPVAAREPGEGNGEGRAVHDQEAGVAAAVEEGIAPVSELRSVLYPIKRFDDIFI